MTWAWDVIHVDAGLYELARTIKIGADDAEYVSKAGDRSGPASSMGKIGGARSIAGIEWRSQDVVIKNLSITDGDHGIAVFGGSQRTRIEN